MPFALLLDCLVFGTWVVWAVFLYSLEVSTTFEPLSLGRLLLFIPVGAALLIGSMIFQASRLTRATLHYKRTAGQHARSPGSSNLLEPFSSPVASYPRPQLF